MNKNKIRKAAYKSIAKEGKSHQEFFDSFKAENKVKGELLAEETAKIPSLSKMKETTTIRYIYVGLLAVILVLRIFGVTELTQSMGMGTGLMVLALILALGVPVIGIIAGLTQRAHFYNPVGLLMALAIMRSFTSKNIEMDETVLIVMIPMAVVIALSFYLPSKLKTTYERKVTKEMKEGNEVTKVSYIFEKSSIDSDEILDAGI